MAYLNETGLAYFKGKLDTKYDAEISALDSKVQELEESAYIINTASGPIASFDDGADGVPVKDLTVGIEPVQAGTGDPSPDNIRPITGWTGANVTRTGKNLFDESTIYHGYYNVSNIDVKSLGEAYRTVELILPAGTYTFSTTLQDCYILRAWYDGINHNVSEKKQSHTITTTTYGTVAVCFRNDSSSIITESFNTQLELGSTATAYEPYSGTTIPITFPTEAGTVYGGSLDVTTGVLTVNWNMIEFDGSSDETWVKYTEGIGGYYVTNVNVHAKEAYADGWCDYFKTAKGINSPGVIYGINSKYLFFMGTIELAGDTIEDWRSWLASNIVHVVFKANTPATYQLTPQEVLTTLYGVNNIFSDSGDTTVQYRADTKLYVDGLFSSQKPTIFDSIAPTEDGDTASQPYEQGAYFLRNGDFCRAKTAIASEATFTLGTNYEVTSVAAALFAALNG